MPILARNMGKLFVWKIQNIPNQLEARFHEQFPPVPEVGEYYGRIFQ
jgi:hypothetical protein